MSKTLKIMAVCGFGIGSSLILKMNLDDVMSKYNIDVETFTNDVTSVASGMADLIFTSNEIADQVKEKVTCPVVVIENFMNKSEIEEKGLSAIKELIK
ncbi:PTS sugar transporter subunit IIB [Romboutsia sp.]|uniref:PTS sugar transporter subunit IIB n=1 Tax=Romboutsia sp. TaxID=1965302 RepID=UPI002C226484|nr:PTS sugar transporter subunit IIB [Romboutsia sp.]HSQ89709.1 PTS sugar transporter subunit IIB [Romboutsia sp.]